MVPTLQVRVALIAALTMIGALGASAQTCPSAGICREAAPGGALLHNRNSSGNRVWTVACRGPNAPPNWSNTSNRREDPICRQISACPAAGGFGRFLQAVTFNCISKHFDGYFGLDGMTFGILDWTSNDLPMLLKAYQTRDPAKFTQNIGALGLPFNNGCLDARWTCNANRQARLTCDAPFNAAFRQALATNAFKKAQVDVALAQYERRLSRYSSLGLTTEYGNTAMAVVANNLRNTAACRPEAWKRACARQPNETKLIDCMLDRYAANACRGSARGSQARAREIKATFAGMPPSSNIHPTAEAVVSCSDKWGTGT